MPSIGDTLREARMRQGLDIADVEARTKIRAKYLRALEHEEFDMLPGATFVKTFIRTYAELVGLDPHMLVEEYRANYEPRDEGEVQTLGPPAASRRDRRRGGALPGPRPTPGPRPGPPGRGVLLAGMAAVLVLAVLLVLGLTGGDDEEPAGERAATTTTERRQQPKPRKRPPRPANAVALRVVPDTDTYVCVDRGPGTDIVFEGTITDPQTFKGKKLRLNLGRTGPELRVNGKPFEVPPAANPVGYEFSPGGSKELPSGERPCA